MTFTIREIIQLNQFSYKCLLLLIIYRSNKKAGKSRERGEVTIKGRFFKIFD